MLLLLLLLLLVLLVVGSKKGVVPLAQTCTNSCLGKTTALGALDMWMWTHEPWLDEMPHFSKSQAMGRHHIPTLVELSAMEHVHAVADNSQLGSSKNCV